MAEFYWYYFADGHRDNGSGALAGQLHIAAFRALTHLTDGLDLIVVGLALGCGGILVLGHELEVLTLAHVIHGAHQLVAAAGLGGAVDLVLDRALHGLPAQLRLAGSIHRGLQHRLCDTGPAWRSGPVLQPPVDHLHSEHKNAPEFPRARKMPRDRSRSAREG